MSTDDIKRAELQTIGQGFYADIKQLVDDLTSERHGDEYVADEEALEAIQNHPLAVSVRSEWTSLGNYSNEGLRASEYQILIATGGPAARIIGDLNSYGEAHTATLQVQDWFTPWTDVAKCDEDTLLTYAQQFYFGE